MSKTARQLIEDAIRELRVVANGEPIKDSHSETGITYFNEMMHGFESKGIYIGYASIGLDDEIPVQPKYIRALRLLLAIDLAPQFGSVITPEVARGAANAERQLQAAFKRIGNLEAPPSMPMGRRRGYSVEDLTNG